MLVLIGQRRHKTHPVVKILQIVRQKQQLQELVASSGHVDGFDPLCERGLRLRLLGLGVAHLAPQLHETGAGRVQVGQTLVVLVDLLIQLVVQGGDGGLHGLGLRRQSVDLGLGFLAELEDRCRCQPRRDRDRRGG